MPLKKDLTMKYTDVIKMLKAAAADPYALDPAYAAGIQKAVKDRNTQIAANKNKMRSMGLNPSLTQTELNNNADAQVRQRLAADQARRQAEADRHAQFIAQQKAQTQTRVNQFNNTVAHMDAPKQTQAPISPASAASNRVAAREAKLKEERRRDAEMQTRIAERRAKAGQNPLNGGTRRGSASMTYTNANGQKVTEGYSAPPAPAPATSTATNPAATTTPTPTTTTTPAAANNYSINANVNIPGQQPATVKQPATKPAARTVKQPAKKSGGTIRYGGQVVNL